MEILAFALSVVCVWLNAQEKVLTWPFAIASSAAYALVFFEARLFGAADAFLTAASLIATFMSARKWRQNWWLWGFADTIYVGLYIYKDLYITALLYGLFVILCLIGWRQWTKQMCQGA